VPTTIGLLEVFEGEPDTFSVATRFMVAECMVRMHAAVNTFSVATRFMATTVRMGALKMHVIE
jgi:hypothetical protein